MDLEFQALLWNGRDVSQTTPESDDTPRYSYKIDVFGKTLDGRSVCLTVPFCPYFFVEPLRGSSPMIFMHAFLQSFQERAPEDYQDLVDASVVSRKRFYGFTNDALFDMIRLVFRSQKSMRKASYLLGAKRKAGAIQVYESNVDPVLRLMHIADLESTGWIRSKTSRPVPEGDRRTTCDLEVHVSGYKDLGPVPDKDGAAPLVIASFDLECTSTDGSFPNPEDPGNKVIQVATTFQRVGHKEPYRRHVACLGTTSEIPGVDVVSLETEPEVLMEWAKVIHQESTDIILGYNIWGFDMNYLWKRLGFMAHGDARRFKCLVGRFRNEPAQFVETTLKSSAYGKNEFKTFETHGRLQVDLLAVLRKDYKLESYKLDSVSEVFLGDHKVDLPIAMMFQMYQRGTPEDLKTIAEYCVKDTELPLRLCDKLSVLANLLEMAKATHVPVDFLIPRGQQIKAFSQILKMARLEGYVCPTDPMTKKEETYEGATVLDAQTGTYWEPVTCLDFASLYPSIMRAHNMCHSTVVLDPTFANVPGVQYFEVDGVRFAQNRQGILPKLLEDLAKFRKVAKKQQALAKDRGDTFMESLYNGKQLAYKVSMNSVYGFCGAANGYLPCLPIASSVTTVGRSMILKTKNIVEERYPGSKVRYGDSVPGYVPCLVRMNGSLVVKVPIQTLGILGEWLPCDNDPEKEFLELTDVESWTDEGFTKVHRIIRHVLGYEKQIVRVCTDTSIVDVTDDHSLVRPDGTCVKPCDLSVGDKLLCAPQDKNPGGETIRSITWGFPYQGYVYDLTTDNHKFQAGIGDIIVHNTDSVMVEFGNGKTLEECFRLGEEVAQIVTETFLRPIELTFEKCYCPFILFSKKRYCGLMFTRPDKPDKIDVKGIQLVRRDNCKLVRRVSKEVLDKIMYHRDLQGAIHLVRQVATDLLENRVDASELVLSKTLKASAEDLYMDLHRVCHKCQGLMDRSDDTVTCKGCRASRTLTYKNMTLPHVHVACRMEQRNPGAGPKANERVPYVFVYRSGQSKNAQQVDRAEDPGYAKEKRLRLDGMYYLEHQLKSPMLQLFEELMPNAQETLFADLERKYANKARGQGEITDFFRKT
jgi:DNA polymerase elongation subunit (family B)